MNFLLVIFLVFSLSVSVTAQTTYDQYMSTGLSSLEKKDYYSSEEAFKAALKEKPDDFKATLYLGIVLDQMGRREAEDLLKKALLMNPQDPQVNLQLGIHYFDKTVYPEARDYFETTIEVAPKTQFSATAEGYLKRMRAMEAEKRWELNVSVGGQYDSNVVLNPSGNPLPQGISHQSDWSAVFLFSGRYHLITEEKADVSAGFNFYQNLHASLWHYNVSQPIFDLTAAYNILPWLQVRGVASWEYLSVGQEEYGNDYMLAPSVVIFEGKGFSTIVDYRYRNYTFYNTQVFFDNEQRSGPDNYIGVAQIIPLSPNVQMRLGYAHDVNATQEAFWHYRGDRGAAGLSFILPYKIFVNLDSDYYIQKYRGTDPETGANRKDKTFTGSASVTKVLSNIFSVTLGEVYVNDNSNVSVFSYNRSITSLFLNARF
ncbi:MAG TPA: tetratricopeptide repeat protein [Thermodesulfovibrionales bacterium]|nr:tetratricopeptide repeat protein [Thermodesulfovibrionales bacterium]